MLFRSAVNNRGAVIARLNRPTEALSDFVRALLLKPDYADAYINGGGALRALGRFKEAANSFDRALALRRDNPVAAWNKGLVKLALGEWREGWPLYESRLQLASAGAAERELDAPRWTGSEALSGKTLLVHAEQGLGDTLQFCRFVPLLEKMGARVVFEVQPVLQRLLSTLPMRGTLIARGDPLPRFDLHVPLLSVPLALRTEIDTIPTAGPYLAAWPEAAQTWRERVQALDGIKVGINWQGNPAAERRSVFQSRSFPLAALAPVAQLPGVTLVSMQKGSGSEQRDEVDFGARITRLTDPLYMGADELAGETAAILTSLDLLITADTALAHLAGALGVRTWIALQAVPDWRWLVGRTDSPWYPSVRLFRQPTPGDWPSVFAQMAEELRPRYARNAES